MVQFRLKPIDGCRFNSFFVAPDHIAIVFAHVSAGTIDAPSWVLSVARVSSSSPVNVPLPAFSTR